jgi:tRNA(Ile)-lysidine synthase
MIMINKVEHTIKKYHLLKMGDHVVVALSGGADSCALLWCLVHLSDAYDLKLTAAHFNHGLRKEQSDEDEVFCHDLAKKFGVEFLAQKLPDPSVPRGVSPEDYLRRERYRFLDGVAADCGADKIALGHHLQDQAETVLLNILRGSGLDGLKGFLPIRDGKYIRPLIDVTRKEITTALKEAGIDFCQDATNVSPVYLRNRLRGELIPLLKKEYNPRIEQNLARMAEIVRRDDEWISGHVNLILTSPQIQYRENQVTFSAEFFQSLHEALRFRLVKALLENLSPEGGGFSSSHIQAVVDLATNSPTGKIITLPHRLKAQKEYDRVILDCTIQKRAADYEYPLTVPGEVVLKEKGIILTAKRGGSGEVDFKCVDRVFFDEDKINKPLMIRNRRKGDWFEPLGTKGSQKIKKLFIDRKVPKGERESIALIADEISIIWIENMHINERVKVTHETKNVLILEIQPLG